MTPSWITSRVIYAACGSRFVTSESIAPGSTMAAIATLGWLWTISVMSEACQRLDKLGTKRLAFTILRFIFRDMELGCF
jgi:hypothetical protein